MRRSKLKCYEERLGSKGFGGWQGKVLFAEYLTRAGKKSKRL